MRVCLSDPLRDRVRAYAKHHHVSARFVVEVAIERLLSYGKREAREVAAELAGVVP